jgi:hypothetical protein
MNSTLPLVYGVWIDGKGWLRGRDQRVWSDMRREYAEEALRMVSGRARVAFIDESMIDLEQFFLDQ